MGEAINADIAKNNFLEMMETAYNTSLNVSNSFSNLIVICFKL